jgi:hypothetical protein
MMLPSSSAEAVTDKEAELERTWVKSFMDATEDSWLLCPTCKQRVAVALNRLL